MQKITFITQKSCCKKWSFTIFRITASSPVGSGFVKTEWLAGWFSNSLSFYQKQRFVILRSLRAQLVVKRPRKLEGQPRTKPQQQPQFSASVCHRELLVLAKVKAQLKAAQNKTKSGGGTRSARREANNYNRVPPPILLPYSRALFKKAFGFLCPIDLTFMAPYLILRSETLWSMTSDEEAICNGIRDVWKLTRFCSNDWYMFVRNLKRRVDCDTKQNQLVKAAATNLVCQNILERSIR